MGTAKHSTSEASSWSAPRSPLVPHAAFWSMGLLFKILFPGVLKWLAYDSITTPLLSVWYPLCATIALIHRDKRRQQLQKDDALDKLQMERQFWIEYWSVGFAGVQFLHRFLSLIPSSNKMGHHAYPRFPIILKEIKLLYFVWIFVMEASLIRYQRYIGVDEQEAHWSKFVPLSFLTKVVGPKLMRVQMTVSEQISKETWERYIKRKVQRVLELMIMLQFMEVESMEYLLQLLEEGRSLFPLSIFLVLPSSISDVGMLYPQFIFPSARSLMSRGEAVEILSLKFWVLNSILSLFLSATWWLWWCIPFSNQLLLGIRCFATYPSTITTYYQMLEMDLITFGILSGEPKMTVKETKTVQALRAIVKRLPRDKQAQSFQFELDEQAMKSKHDDDDSSIGSEDTTESEEERRRKRRREKRAKRKLLKQKKLSGSSESLVAIYGSDGDREKYGKQKNDASSDDEANFSSFINTNDNKFYQDGRENIVPNLPPKEQRDARNAAAKDSTSHAEMRHVMSFSTADSRSMSLSIDTPIESVEGEVEVQVKGVSERSNTTTKSKTVGTTLFPATYPTLSRSGLITPLSSNDEISTKSSMTSLNILSSMSQPQLMDNGKNNDVDSGFCLSDIDTAASSTIAVNESFEVWSPASNDATTYESYAAESGEEMTNGKGGQVADVSIIHAPTRRSSRLIQLREWQEQKRAEKEFEQKKKQKALATKPSKKEKPKTSDMKLKVKSSVEKKSKKPAEKENKSKNSSTGRIEKTTASSPKRSSKKSKKTSSEIDSDLSRPTASSPAKKVKKKSSATSPAQSTSEDKGESPSQDNIDMADRSPDSSPGKTSRKMSKKVPNSRRKKSIFGSVLGRS